MNIKKKIKKIKYYYNWGARYLNDPFNLTVKALSEKEIAKKPSRSEIINYLIDHLNRKAFYLEIGVRNPVDNYDKIKAETKYSVDPGIEFEENPVDFKMTSDVFFDQLREGKILSKDLKFDVIFIDGLHLAEQVDRDITNALDFIKDDGFIVLHDCNPPSEWHAREEHNYRISPAEDYWNGTTWKAFYKWRCNPDVYSCCIDTDWGIGVISKKINVGTHYSKNQNEFYDFNKLNEQKDLMLNLISIKEFYKIINNQT